MQMQWRVAGFLGGAVLAAWVLTGSACTGRQCGAPTPTCEDGKQDTLAYCDETVPPKFTACGGGTCVLGDGPCPTSDGGVLDGGTQDASTVPDAG